MARLVVMKRSLANKTGARHLIGIGITALCLVIMARQINLAELAQAFAQFKWPYLILGIASLAFGYALRVFRWSLMLRASGAAVGWGGCSAPFLGSIALNNVLPLRMGDVVRALVFPAAIGVSRTTATSSLVMERLIDLLTLLACLLIGLVATQAAHLPPAFAQSAVVIAVAGALLMTIGFIFSGSLSRMFHRLARSGEGAERGRLHGVLMVIGNLFDSFDAMSRPRVLFAVIGVSMLVWVGESGLFYFMLLGFGLDASPALAVVVMAIATLSTLVPSAPGYIGPFHLAAFTAITMLGGTAAQAGSYAVLSHLALWVPTTLAGAIAIWLRPGLFQGLRSAASTERKSAA